MSAEPRLAQRALADAAAFRATRGYIIYLHVADERHLQTIYKSHWFWGKDGVLSTVELPEGAPDASSPSASP
jgi:hypothetical protein